jgi:tetratricopeptide (TPR) repeat protein
VRWHPCCVLLTTCLLLPIGFVHRPPIALAQAAPESANRTRSKALVASGNAHFRLGEFSDALKLYKEAYRLHASPRILFNVGQCHRQLRQLDQALFVFKSYLVAAPDAPNRADVEAIIGELEAKIRSAAQPTSTRLLPRAPAPLAAGAPAREAHPPSRLPVYKRWWFWTIIGAVVVGATVGGVVAGTRTVCAAGSSAPGCN